MYSDESMKPFANIIDVDSHLDFPLPPSVSSYNEQEIEEQVDALRASLMSEGRPVDLSSHETHHMAEATESKRQQLRSAFKIRDDYVDGTAFDPVQQAMRATQAKLEREQEME